MKYPTICFLAILLLPSCNTTKSKDIKEPKNEAVEKIVPTDTLDVEVGSKLVLTEDIDLKNEIVLVPKGVTLYAQGGILKNGTLVGSSTKIQGNNVVFGHVTIKGTWNVPNINTDMFTDLSYDNSLRDVIALSNDMVQNNILIHAGTYIFSFQNNGETGIAPASNTKIIIDGSLTLKPNDFQNYCIINVKGENIHISGNGLIYGDKFTHTGTEGEWGMGVNFSHAKNCSITGLTIKNCWGDCIYVGSNSKNVNIKNCILDNGRRQGISITSGENIRIADCKISNVGGTNPEYAIDIEPNKGGFVNDVEISNCKSINCKGGYLCWGGAKDAYIGSVVLTKCSVSGNISKNPYNFVKVHNLRVRNCTGNKNKIVVKDVDKSILINNKIAGKTGANIFTFEGCNPTKLK